MNITQKTLNYFKSLTAETISNAGSGHTGSAIGASSIMLALFKNHLKFNPANPNFLNRDRFVLSAGHASAMYYSLLHLFGYDVTIEDLKNFRKCGSKTPGHPEKNVVPGVETSTGPLGQGIANAVGLAIAESIFEAKFNTPKYGIFNNYTYCYAGDGCLMEGVAVEACSLAGTLALNKLILLYDDNNITIDGKRTLANAENTAEKFKAMGWNTIEVQDGHNFEDCSNAIAKAKQSTDKPTIIIFKTIIGIGTSKAGTEKVHAYPLPAEELVTFKQSLGVNESFFVPEDVYDYCNLTVKNNQIYELAWNKIVDSYKFEHPDKYAEISSLFAGKPFAYNELAKALSKMPEQAGRDISKIVLNELAKVHTELVGGTADLGASTKAVIEGAGDYSKNNRTGRNIHFGIREHSMGAIANGISIYANLPAFDSTFLAFSNYMLPAIRMRAMMNLPVFTVFTHDSIDVGQDGPTHQPIEQIGGLRQIIGLLTYRPATPAEVVAGYKVFFETKKPMAMVFSKSKLKPFENSTVAGAEKGGYVIFETGANPDIEIISTGKDVELAIEVAKAMKGESVRVVSMPCESLFASQSTAYKNKVLLSNAKLKVAIEASNDPVWYKYIGTNGLVVSVNDYQTSGPSSEVYSNAGYNAKNIVSLIKKKLK